MYIASIPIAYPRNIKLKVLKFAPPFMNHAIQRMAAHTMVTPIRYTYNGRLCMLVKDYLPLCKTTKNSIVSSKWKTTLKNACGVSLLHFRDHEGASNKKSPLRLFPL